jgi:2-oxo-4-hydroxy-4-carboxy-5-ureidoimidazoline decarboxylase
MAIRIAEINAADEARFVELLGGVFEHSPWVAERAYSEHPFESRADLHRKMADVVRGASAGRQLDLLCQHPELAGKEARAKTLTHASQREQSGAGLDQCSPEELARIRHLNHEYREKFGFPFIIAVRGLGKQQVIDAMQRRLAHSPETEFAAAIDEVEKIARLRLEALIDD